MRAARKAAICPACCPGGAWGEGKRGINEEKDGKKNKGGGNRRGRGGGVTVENNCGCCGNSPLCEGFL